MAGGINFAVGTRVRANKFRGTVVQVKPTHHLHQGKIPVDSGRSVKWFRPEELKVESETLPLLEDCNVDGFNVLQSEQPSSLVVEPDSTNTCPKCSATLSLAQNGSSGSVSCAYCEWSPPGEDTLLLISLEQTSIDPQRLQPHPENDRIYGEHEDVSTLVELIQQSGWIKPIVVSQRGRIISGHRRWKVALELRWLEVPIIVQEFSNEVAELEALLLENASRDKTAEQKVREGRTWESIEGERALLRQKATQNNNAGRAVVENFPQLVSGGKGKTRDAIALRVGLGSGRNYDKARQVVEEIDKLAATHFEQNQEFARVLKHTLNKKSVHAAYQLIHPAPSRKSRQPLAASIAVSELSPESQSQLEGVSVKAVTSEQLPVTSTDSSLNTVEGFPPSLLECLTALEVYAFVEQDASRAKTEFLTMGWSDRNSLRELTQNTIDSSIMGKLKDLGQDFSQLLGLLDTDRLAQIEYLKRELETLKRKRDELQGSGNSGVLELQPHQLMLHLRSDEWLQQTITLSQGELSRRGHCLLALSSLLTGV